MILLHKEFDWVKVVEYLCKKILPYDKHVKSAFLSLSNVYSLKLPPINMSWTFEVPPQPSIGWSYISELRRMFRYIQPFRTPIMHGFFEGSNRFL